MIISEILLFILILFWFWKLKSTKAGIGALIKINVFLKSVVN